MLKKCPECGFENEAESLGCECGYCFVDTVAATQTSYEMQVMRVRRNRAVKRGFTVAAIVVFLVAGVTYFSGVLRASEELPSSETSTPTTQTEADTNTKTAEDPTLPSENKPYRVIKVSTGDNIDIVDEHNRQFRIALFGVRAPKLNEHFGTESQQNLSNRLLGRIVTIKTKKVGEDGSIYAEVLAGNQNVGLSQVEAGMVIVATGDLIDQTEPARRGYLNAELTAKVGRYGIWSGTDTPPVSTSDERYTAATVPETYKPGGILQPAAPLISQPVDQIAQPASDPNLGRQQAQEKNKTAEVLPSQDRSSPVKPPVNQPQASPPPKSEVSTSTKQNGTAEIKYIRGPRGGCYYLTASGSKKYVDRSVCN